MRVTPWHPGAGLVYARGHTVPPVHGAVPGCPALALRVTSCTFGSAIARQYLQASWGSLGDTANRGILGDTVEVQHSASRGEGSLLQLRPCGPGQAQQGASSECILRDTLPTESPSLFITADTSTETFISEIRQHLPHFTPGTPPRHRLSRRRDGPPPAAWVRL